MEKKREYIDSEDLIQDDYIVLFYFLEKVFQPNKEEDNEDNNDKMEQKIFKLLSSNYEESDEKSGESLRQAINKTDTSNYLEYSVIVNEVTKYRTICTAGNIARALNCLARNGLLLRHSERGKAYFKKEPDFNGRLKKVCEKINKYIDAYNNNPFIQEEDFYSKLGLEDKTIDEIINDITSKCRIPDKDYDSSKIKSKKESLIDYIKNVIEIESTIYSLKERYARLLHSFQNLIERHLLNISFSTSLTIINKIEELKDNANSHHEDNKPNLEEFINNNCPSKPVFELEVPVRPNVKKAGLFNKKKIELENNKMLEEYEKAIKEYEEKKKEFLDKTKEYERKLEEHKKEATKEYEKALKEFEIQENEKRKNQEEQKKELNSLKNEPEKHIMELLNENEYFNKTKSIAYEMSFIVYQLEKFIEIRSDMYSYNIIYGKYRNFIALSSFMDYFMSGRCETLEGSTGAYNLYEQESRSDIIINKMDIIINRLDQIADNQYYIYNKLSEINDSLRMISDQLLVTNMLQVVEIAQLSEVIDNTKQISYNTEVTAYYSQQTAKYAKALTYINFLALK